MLVETNPSGEWKIGAHAHEHPAPALVVDIEVVLHDPAIGDLQVPGAPLLTPDRGHDPRRFSGFEDDDDLIRRCFPEVGLDKLVTTTLWSLDDGGVPPVRLFLHPKLKLFSSAAQDIPADRVQVPISVEEPHHSLGLLERLDKAVEQNPVKTPIAEADAILVMFVERIHGRLPDPKAGRIVDRHLTLCAPRGVGYQGQSPWLVGFFAKDEVPITSVGDYACVYHAGTIYPAANDSLITGR